MYVHHCIPVSGWRDVGPTSSNIQSTLSSIGLHSDGTIAKSCSKRRESRLITTTVLSIVVTLYGNQSRGPTRHVSLCSRVVALSRINGRRNKRSIVTVLWFCMYSCHAAANKQITESCRCYVSPFDISCANHSTICCM